jgi:H+/Cl- antiporter ClcA
LNSLLVKQQPAAHVLLLPLLFVKTIMTAVAAGSGFIGGTFALALFCAMVAHLSTSSTSCRVSGTR